MLNIAFLYFKILQNIAQEVVIKRGIIAFLADMRGLRLPKPWNMFRNL